MNAIEAFEALFGIAPTRTQINQAENYGGLNSPEVINSLKDQAEGFLDQIERLCGIRFQREVVAGLVELREDRTDRTDDYVLRSCFGRETAAHLIAAKVPRQDDVAAIYRAVLRREPDPSGHAYYTGKIARGEMTLSQFCDELYYNQAKDLKNHMKR